jgi:hypothetical protein
MKYRGKSCRIVCHWRSLSCLMWIEVMGFWWFSVEISLVSVMVEHRCTCEFCVTLCKGKAIPLERGLDRPWGFQEVVWTFTTVTMVKCATVDIVTNTNQKYCYWRLLSSGMWCVLSGLMCKDVSEEPAVFIMYPDDKGSRFFGNSGKYITDYMVSDWRRQ